MHHKDNTNQFAGFILVEKAGHGWQPWQPPCLPARVSKPTTCRHKLAVGRKWATLACRRVPAAALHDLTVLRRHTGACCADRSGPRQTMIMSMIKLSRRLGTRVPCTAYVGYRRCGVERSSRGSTQQQKRTGEEKRREEKRRDDGTRCRTVKYHPRGTRAGPSLSNSSLSREINSRDLARDAGFSARAASGTCQFCFERYQ